jgi:tRNA threonylcarbamoyladenosine biosynthesis protein TsaE
MNSAAAAHPVTGADALVAVTGSADQTRQLAGALAPLCEPGDVVLLAGDLGAGKTTFAQGFGAALGVTEPITSPTFVLVHQYPLGEGGPVRVLLHADVYRLDHLHEIVELGLGELVEDGGVALVEWGDAAEPVLGSGALAVRLEVADGREEARVITASAVDDAWSGRWDALAEAMRPWRVVR